MRGLILSGCVEPIGHGIDVIAVEIAAADEML